MLGAYSKYRKKTKSYKRKYTSARKGTAKRKTYKRKYMGNRAKKRRAGASRVTAAPVQMGTSVSGGLQASFTQKQMSGGGLRITGRSFITSIDSTGKYSNGLIAIHDCNPVLHNDRVATIATTYEKYVYQSVTYRFVPQCATTTPGSIMLTFERDPANPAAHGGDGSTFMQNVMSYEHTAISPPWVGTSVTYKRDANEKKLFWISGQGSNYDPRETSQGMFMCYGANIPVDLGLGFIVMDYVLDLCQPSIMPARTGAGIAGVASATNIPAQFQFTNASIISKIDGAGASGNANVLIPAGFSPPTLFANQNADCIVELLIEGTRVPTAGNALWSTSEFQAKANVPTTLTRGSHVFLTLRRLRTGLIATNPTLFPSNQNAVIVTRSLPDAIAALSGTADGQTVTGAYAYSNALYPLANVAINTDMQFAGFYRQITLRADNDYQV